LSLTDTVLLGFALLCCLAFWVVLGVLWLVV
jgi:hypothetical protein